MSASRDPKEIRAQLITKGQEVLDSMQGQGTGEKQMTAQSEFTRPAHEYLFANCFEGIWGREGLEKRYRSLTVISILASTGKIPQLKAHARMGLMNGLKEEEIRECLLHVMGYCGFPAGLDAFAAADEAIKAYRSMYGHVRML